MARYLFIAQQTLATWVDHDKISFDGNVMTIKADGRQFRLIEAVRFIKVEGGEQDSARLLGKVKTNEQLACMGAERYRDSVLYADVAYRVQEGFIGEVFLSRLETESTDRCVEASASPRRCRAEQCTGAAGTEATRAKAKQNAAAADDRPLASARTQPVLPQAAGQRAEAPAADVRAGQPRGAESKTDGDLSDEELLTRFLLDNL